MTRVARERLAAIKKFIPVTDSVRSKLQLRQELQTDFANGSKELFNPITTANKDVKTAIERAIYGYFLEEGEWIEAPLLSVHEKITAENNFKQNISIVTKKIHVVRKNQAIR